MVTLKIADLEDLLEVKRMCLLFKEHSPYKTFLVEEDKLEETLKGLLIEGNQSSIILLAVVNNKPVGMLICLSREFLFSREKHATELAWWVDPEHRDGPGRALQEAFVYWAKKVDCKYLHMTLLQDKEAPKMKKLYKRLGYRLMEQAWIKEI